MNFLQEMLKVCEKYAGGLSFIYLPMITLQEMFARYTMGGITQLVQQKYWYINKKWFKK
jgi:hypothetical protein